MHGFVFLSPLFGNTNLCFSFSCPAIGNKKHDVKKQQKKSNLRLELQFFHKLMVIIQPWDGQAIMVDDGV